MFKQLVSLILLPLLLLPAGACPCHLFEDHAEEAVCSPDCGQHEEQDANTGNGSHHDEDPCDNCQARKLTEGQYTSAQGQSFAWDTLPVYVALIELPLFSLTQSSEVVAPGAGPFLWCSSPIYLTLRALLL